MQPAIPAEGVRVTGPPSPAGTRPYFASSGRGWAVPFATGVVCGMSYLGAVLLLGWLSQVVRARVLHGWWRRSGLADETSFGEFAASLGPDVPELPPRWVFSGRFGASALRPLAVNLKLGVVMLFATFLLTGWGTTLMTFSWEFGWMNSFTKGYETARAGPAMAILGIVLFVAAMVHVPLAQVHLAATGDLRAFFDFPFVWRLVRVRLMGVYLLGLVYLAFGLVAEFLKTAAYFLDTFPAWEDAGARTVYLGYLLYYLGCSVHLLAALLATRLFAARVYGAAVLKALRQGAISRKELHPRIAEWLGRLELLPPAGPARAPASPAKGYALGGVLFLSLLCVWTVFTVKTYLGEFFHYHPVVGFLNRPLVQLPCVNHLPDHLRRESGW